MASRRRGRLKAPLTPRQRWQELAPRVDGRAVEEEAAAARVRGDGCCGGQDQGGAERAVALKAHGCFWASHRRSELLAVQLSEAYRQRASRAVEARNAVGAELRREPTYNQAGVFGVASIEPLDREALSGIGRALPLQL